MEPNTYPQSENAIRKPEEVYHINDVVDFKVIKNLGTHCTLYDDKTGIVTFLQNTSNLKIFEGQILKCKITGFNEKHPLIELLNLNDYTTQAEGLSESTFESILLDRRNYIAQRDMTDGHAPFYIWDFKELFKLLHSQDKSKTFESKVHDYIQYLNGVKEDLNMIREDCLYLLEESPLLDDCSFDEREFYQKRFTLLIEQLGYYIKAKELIENEDKKDVGDNTGNLFIRTIIDKLSHSGYVYHPNKNFSILSALFLLHPALMDKWMVSLLDALYRKDLKEWTKEPFRSALIKVLELYVSINLEKIDKSVDAVFIIRNCRRALGMQLLLLNVAKDRAMADPNLSYARLCHTLSYTKMGSRPVAVGLIDHAFFYLLNSTVTFPKYTIDTVSADSFPYLVNNSPIRPIDTINTFSSRTAELAISSEGIRLTVANEKGGPVNEVLPNNLGLWKGLQVYTDPFLKNKVFPEHIRKDDLTPYRKIWKEIERELFKVSAAKSDADKGKKKSKGVKRHLAGDTVEISIVRQDEKDPNKFYCRIEDEIGGEGYIFVKDIVPYKVNAEIQDFYVEGERMVFNADILEVRDGYHLSMHRDIKEYVNQELYHSGMDILCSLGGTPEKGSSVIQGITVDGASASIYLKDVSRNEILETEQLSKHDYVWCYYQNKGKENQPNHIVCVIIRKADETEEKFSLNDAFRNLMEEVYVRTVSESDQGAEIDENKLKETDRFLDDAYLQELIFLIDRMAALDADDIKAYNYLGFARVLSLLIGWESQAKYYKIQMGIREQLQYFAVNNKIDEKALEDFEDANAEQFNLIPSLKERFLSLQAVSYLRTDTHSEELFKLKEEGSSSLSKLAAYVSAYNTIYKEEGMQNAARDIYNKILGILELKGYETGLKEYEQGLESETVEFKTSFVYTAEKMVDPLKKGLNNPNEQRDKILTVINSFMNTAGGKLYLGVNDQGMGVGLEGDLSVAPYFEDKDKYRRAITDAVALKWGNDIQARGIASAEWDLDNPGKDVLIIKVNRIDEGVPFDKGLWYIRTGSATKRLNYHEFLQFKDYTRGTDDYDPLFDELDILSREKE